MESGRRARRILAIADSPGHLLERLAHSWVRHARGVDHDVAASWGRTSYSLAGLATRHDGVHWLDQLRFEGCGAAVERPQVVMVHHLVPGMHRTLLPRLHRADALASPAESWKGRLEKLTGRPVELLPNGIDTEVFRPPAPEERRRARETLDDRFVAGFVGKAAADHEGRKGLDLLLEVGEAAAGIWPDLLVLFVGPGWDGLAARLEERGVATAQRVYPSTLETVQAYWGMDVLLVTSRIEGGPCTTLEAMGSGVPVIAPEVGHVPETVRDGESGFICRNREVREYLASIRAIRESPALRTRVAGAARDFVARERDERVVVPRLPLADLYDRAAASFRQRSGREMAARRLARGRLLLRHVVHHAMRPRG